MNSTPTNDTMTRPWDQVAAEFNRRNPGRPITAKAAKQAHAAAMQKLRNDPAVRRLLSDFADAA